MDFEPITLEYAKQIASWRNDPKVIPALRSTKETNPDNQIEWVKKISIDHTCYYTAIVEGGELLGYCGVDKITVLNAEISLLINPQKHGFKIGTEAIVKFMKVVFSKYDIYELYAEVNQTTTAVKFWEKIGFVKVFERENVKFHDGKYHNSDILTLKKEDYFKKWNTSQK